MLLRAGRNAGRVRPFPAHSFRRSAYPTWVVHGRAGSPGISFPSKSIEGTVKACSEPSGLTAARSDSRVEASVSFESASSVGTAIALVAPSAWRRVPRKRSTFSRPRGLHYRGAALTTSCLMPSPWVFSARVWVRSCAIVLTLTALGRRASDCGAAEIRSFSSNMREIPQ